MRALLWQSAMILIGISLTALSGRAMASSMASEAVTYPSVSVSRLAPALAREVKRGEYLTRLSDCAACHTEHGAGKTGSTFAGGLPMKTPFGTIYSPNITPDKATGIGTWSFKQFDAAVRFGDSPQGYLFAAMPYNYYDIMSREQVHAIWEYMKRVPAVHQPDKPLDMAAPFRWRWIQAGWRFAFFRPHDHRFKPDPSHSAEWNRGRFIVEGPEHCGGCHTPHNMLGGSETRFFLQGSTISGSWAPDVTGLTLAPYSIRGITRVFRKGKGLNGGELEGSMLDAVANSMHYMRPADMRAVAVYLKTVSSEIPPGTGSVSISSTDLSLGHKTYQTHCAACHSTGAGGTPRVGKVSEWEPIEKTPLFVLYENVEHGVSIMPPRGGCRTCSKRALTSAIAYMLRQSNIQKTEKTNPVSGTANAARIPAGTVSLAIGKQVYAAHCAVCHAHGLAGAPTYGDTNQWAKRLHTGIKTLRHDTLAGIGAMPPKGGCAGCTQAQIVSAMDYIVAGSGGRRLVQRSLSKHK